jgi:hypothetical protein
MLVNASRMLTLVAVCIGLGVGIVEGQLPLSPYSDFSSLSADQLAGAQVRFTFVGEHGSRGLPTLGMTTTGATVDLSGFLPYYRTDLRYVEDATPMSLTVSPVELKALVDSVATLPEVTDGGVDSAGVLSFGIYCLVDGQPRCFESVVEGGNGRHLFTKILAALEGNDETVGQLSRHACMLGMLQGPTPIVVDDRVTIALRGFRRQRGTDEFVGKVRLTNTSTTALDVPLAVALGPPLGMKVLNPSGFTCYIQPGGMAFVRFPAASPVGPGSSTEVVVRLLNPDHERVQMEFVRAFVDSGGR